MDDVLQYGQRVLLVQAIDRSYLVRLEPGGRFSSHVGQDQHDRIVGLRPGQWVRSHRGGAMLLLRPSTADLMMKVKRQTNINYPKDVAQLLLHCGIVPGTRVLEVGTGSGSLTIALALSVGPTGRIYTYDVRADLQKRGRSNVVAAGLEDRVEFALREPGEPFGQTDLDVAVLDVPTPWLEVEAVAKALKLGGRLASLNPTFNQIEQCAVALEASGCFALVEAEEILWRRILARAGRTRPEQRMVGHTEFLLYAIRADALLQADASEADALPLADASEVDALPQADASEADVIPQADASEADVIPHADASEANVIPHADAPEAGTTFPTEVRKAGTLLQTDASEPDAFARANGSEPDARPPLLSPATHPAASAGLSQPADPDPAPQEPQDEDPLRHQDL